MSWKKLKESEYKTYFDKLSKALPHELVEIEVMAVGILDKELAHWIPLYGISYDPKEKTISIITEHIDHQIKQPQDVQIHTTDSGLDSLQISGADGYEHLLKFKKPISL